MDTVDSYLAARFSQIGLKHHFAVAGDFNLVLLDQLLTNKDLEQVGYHQKPRGFEDFVIRWVGSALGGGDAGTVRVFRC